jgi:uncharacterized DUF497 family protein
MGQATIAGRRFEWDDAKRRKVLRDHGIDLEQIGRVFAEPFLETYDAVHSSSEDRFKILGSFGEAVVAVSFCYRGPVIRLITARRATKYERSIYYRRVFGF